MALKKGVFESYLDDRRRPDSSSKNKKANSSYTHNRVFDEPEALKQLVSDASSTSSLSESNINYKSKENLQSDVIREPNEIKNITPLRTESSYNKYKNVSDEKNYITEKPTHTTSSRAWSFSRLKGNERNILLYIYDICRSEGSKISGPVYINHICNSCSINWNTAHRSIARLIKKAVLNRESYEPGRGGYTVYRLPDVVYDEIFSIEKTGRLREKIHPFQALQSHDERRSYVYEEPDVLGGNTRQEMSEDWKAIDIAPLASMNFGLSELRNIYTKSKVDLSADQVQDSIYQFAYGLKNNPDRYKSMKSKSAVLVSHLINNGKWEEGGYIPQAELDRITKQKKLYDTFNQSAFNEWFDSLREEDREKIMPEGIKDQPSYQIKEVKREIQKEQAKIFFDREKWPRIIEELS